MILVDEGVEACQMGYRDVVKGLEIIIYIFQIQFHLRINFHLLNELFPSCRVINKSDKNLSSIYQQIYIKKKVLLWIRIISSWLHSSIAFKKIQRCWITSYTIIKLILSSSESENHSFFHYIVYLGVDLMSEKEEE